MNIYNVVEVRKNLKEALDKAETAPVYIRRGDKMYRLMYESTLVEKFDKEYGEPVPIDEPTIAPMEDVA